MTEATDAHRPAYHFLPPANWMNDPNGLIQWRRRYHLFYQYNPNGAFHGTIHWGHAVSDDLVHWRDLPIALEPTLGGADKDGVFSGCAVDCGGVPMLLYTGVFPEVQCLAEAVDPDDPDLVAWRKHPVNPVIGAPPAGLELEGFRDPFVWREADGWYCAVGSGLKNGGGLVLLYRSSDLVHWEFLNELCRGEAEHTGSTWECPNFFPLGEKHVLLISPMTLHKVLYMVGSYREHRFWPEQTGILDDGGSFYAAQVTLEESGRRLMWGWLRESRDGQAQRAAGWSGVMSLPAELALTGGGTLSVRPAAELTLLRGARRHYSHLRIRPGEETIAESIGGNCLEIQASFALGAASQVGLYVLQAPGGVEQTCILYDSERQELAVDRRGASLDPATVRDVRSMPLRIGRDALLTLHVFVDGSVIEVFADDRVCLRSRVYPSRADSRALKPFARGGAAELISLDVWEMQSIWPPGIRPAISAPLRG